MIFWEMLVRAGGFPKKQYVYYTTETTNQTTLHQDNQLHSYQHIDCGCIVIVAYKHSVNNDRIKKHLHNYGEMILRRVSALMEFLVCLRTSKIILCIHICFRLWGSLFLGGIWFFLWFCVTIQWNFNCSKHMSR